MLYLYEEQILKFIEKLKKKAKLQTEILDVMESNVYKELCDFINKDQASVDKKYKVKLKSHLNILTKKYKELSKYKNYLDRIIVQIPLMETTQLVALSKTTYTHKPIPDSNIINKIKSKLLDEIAFLKKCINFNLSDFFDTIYNMPNFYVPLITPNQSPVSEHYSSFIPNMLKWRSYKNRALNEEEKAIFSESEEEMKKFFNWLNESNILKNCLEKDEQLLKKVNETSPRTESYEFVNCNFDSISRVISNTSYKLSYDYPNSVSWKKELDTKEKFEKNIAKYLYRYSSGDKKIVPRPTDISQFNISSCGILAALIGLAKTNPGFIQHTLIDENNGKITVKFHTNPKNPISVNRTALDYNVFKKYLPGCRHKAAWPLIVECAYIQTIKKLKSNITGEENEGGTIAPDVLFQLTGKISKQMSTQKLITLVVNPSEQYKKIEKILSKHKFATVFFDNIGSNNIGIYTQHSYCLLGLTVKDGKEYVILQNPHGTITRVTPDLDNIDINKLPEFKSLSDIKSKGKIKREFKIPVKTFFNLYPHISYYSSKQAMQNSLKEKEQEQNN